MSTHSLKEPDRCPDCKELLEIASNADPQKGNVPKPGDISFCFSCGCALVFGKQMEMTRLPSHMLDVEGRYIQDQIRELRKKDEALII